MTRQEFFCFHYEDVKSFRANVVRNHWLTKADRKDAGFFDASLWEKTKGTGDLSLKRLINGGLDLTSGTCVLIGSDTYDRRWIKYEIFKSIEKGNRVIGVHINGIKDKAGSVKDVGPNPFQYVALAFSADGLKGTPMDWSGGKWKRFELADVITFYRPVGEEHWGKTVQLSLFFQVYDWVRDDGYANFAQWVES